MGGPLPRVFVTGPFELCAVGGAGYEENPAVVVAIAQHDPGSLCAVLDRVPRVGQGPICARFVAQFQGLPQVRFVSADIAGRHVRGSWAPVSSTTTNV